MNKYTSTGLNMITALAPQIRAASEYYGTSPLAIAGAVAQEQLNQEEHWERAALSSAYAHTYLGVTYAAGLRKSLFTDPLHANTAAKRVASDIIASDYNTTPDLETTGKDLLKKGLNPILIDYGPGGVKFSHVITNVLSNPSAPGLAPYVNDFYNLGVNLQNGSDPQLTASAVGGYIQQGQQVIASLMGGEDAWNNLDPALRDALLVQYHNQGPARNIAAAREAQRNGQPYIPHIGEDGAGANYMNNEGVLAVALTRPAFWIEPAKSDPVPARRVFPSYVPNAVPGPNPFNPGGLLEQGYVPQSDGDSNTNALIAFSNPNSGRINRNALIGPVY